LLFFLWLACSHGLEEGEELPGGATTNTFLLGSNAFILPAENMLVEHEPSFYTGNSFFNQAWVETPSSTVNRDGLGPNYNARSCAACHFRDGRARPPEDDEEFLGLLIRLLPAEAGQTNEILEHYGPQLQNFSVLEVPAEARPRVAYTEISGAYGDGESYTLLEPTYSFEEEAFGTLGTDIIYSPRIAPGMVGLGLLEAIDPQDILSYADPEDLDQDGISGSIHYVTNVETNQTEIGRFGWRSEQPTIRQQVAGAFVQDIGITNPIFSDENCTSVQLECINDPSGGEPEIRAELFDKVVLYSSLLAVPVRRGWMDKTVLKGKRLFNDIGCADCHIPSYVTGEHALFPEVSGQLIWPYTDLLLHDMGPGLADQNGADQEASREWRTPPLWSVGLVKSVNNHTRFLHDGRARNLTEAILWHAGEAAESQENFRQLSKTEREAVVAFIESL